MINLYLADCMVFMKDKPDNYYELAICDPPYGETCRLTGGKSKKDGYADYWDKITDKDSWNVAPEKEYFNEIFRVSKNQIIWGANHYPQFLNPSSGWVLWDKGQREFSFSDGELAYTSFIKKLKIVTIHRAELHKEYRIHPTQKPVKLYEWLLMNYAKEGDKILDTHLGSGSIAIACHNLGFSLDGCELDKEYYEDALKRFKTHKSQLRLYQ